MTTRSKALGSGLETRVVKRAERLGLTARRQPGSGVYREFPNDVLIEAPGLNVLIECKVRSTHPSMAEMLAWLEQVEKNGRRLTYPGAMGAVVYNPKGSRKPKVLLDLDEFLGLVASNIRL